jgi:hypothetical protein
MSGGMEASRDSATTMLERTPVMTAKIAMIDYRRAARNVSVAAEEHAAATPARAPRAETPSEAAKNSNADSHAEGQADTQHDAHRRRYHNKARPGGNEPAPEGPRIVIGNENHSRIDRCNRDHAGVSNAHSQLRRRN